MKKDKTQLTNEILRLTATIEPYQQSALCIEIISDNQFEIVYCKKQQIIPEYTELYKMITVNNDGHILSGKHLPVYSV